METVADEVAQLPRYGSHRLSVGMGTKGARIYDWAQRRVIESRDDPPSRRSGSWHAAR